MRIFPYALRNGIEKKLYFKKYIEGDMLQIGNGGEIFLRII